MDINFCDAFDSVMILNNSKERVKISHKDGIKISFNKNLGFIEDYFNFVNNNISIHLLKKKYEKSTILNQQEKEEIEQIALKYLDNFEKIDLKKFKMPVIIETFARFIDESNFTPYTINNENDKSKIKILKQRNHYFLIQILFHIERIEKKLQEDYIQLLLLNKIKIPVNFEQQMKKENFYVNYFNRFASLLSQFYMKNEIISFYVKIINIYFAKAIIKNSEISNIKDYSTTPQIFVEKSLIKFAGLMTKKLSGFVLPCIKSAVSIHPLAYTVTQAGSFLIGMIAGKLEKKMEKESDNVVKNDMYNFIIEQINEISLLEKGLLDLIKSLLFYKISKTNENREYYKEKIMKTKNDLTKFLEIEDVKDINDSFICETQEKYTIEECIRLNSI